MQNSLLDKLAAFFGGAVLGGLFAFLTKGDQQIGDTKLSVAVIGAYLGTAAFAAVYAVWKPIAALWIFWFMAAVAIVWSL